METVQYVIGVAVVILGLLSAVFFSAGHREAGLWTSCAAVVFAVIGGFAWYQDRLWKRDQTAATLSAKRPRILFVENRLILPDKGDGPLRLAFGLMNTGDADAVFKIWDRTYFFSVDPAKTTFEYQPAPPEEMPVAAIQNAVWRGELRFDFQLTKEKLDALRDGKARLFFYARGEYRDPGGKTYPLPLAEMYDALIPGNLVAPPKGIVFR